LSIPSEASLMPPTSSDHHDTIAATCGKVNDDIGQCEVRLQKVSEGIDGADRNQITNRLSHHLLDLHPVMADMRLYYVAQTKEQAAE